MHMRAFKYVTFTTVLTLVMMIVVAGLVVSRVPAQWLAVESTVKNTAIETRSDGGPPFWALIVEFEYFIADRTYAGEGLRVYSNDDWDMVEAEQKKWPAGKTFATYSNPQDFESVSLYEDGGREGPAVAAALLTPAFVILAMIFVYKRRQPKGIRDEVL